MRTDKLLVETQGIRLGKKHSNIQGNAKLIVTKGFNEPTDVIQIDTVYGYPGNVSPMQAAVINLTFADGKQWSGTFEVLQRALSPNCDFKKHIDSIAAKLSAEGVTQANYKKDAAMKILGETVAPVFCRRVLSLYENEVIAKLSGSGDIKYFPNGFTNWMETHHEVVSFISWQLHESKGNTVVKEWHDKTGTGGLYELAEEWTNEFEEKYQGTEWGVDLEYFDTIEEWLKEKNTI